MINKVYGTGDNDWLELFNFGDFDFDLRGAVSLRKNQNRA